MAQEFKESLFFDKRTIQYMNNISTELLELIIMTPIIYYSVVGDLTETTDDIYGESQNKTFRQPVQLYGRILYNEPIVVSGTFSSENQYSLGLYLQHDRIEDYEVTTVKYPQMIGGLPQFQLGVILDCISVRQNVFNPEKQGPFDPSIQGDSTVNI
jgi:hypothetical protein